MWSKLVFLVFSLCLGSVWGGLGKNPDDSVNCALCSLVVNEIEGFLNENLTQKEIEDYLRKDFCQELPDFYQNICFFLVAELPTSIEWISHYAPVDEVCMYLGLCEKRWGPRPDLVPIEKFVINLDLPPEKRWVNIASQPKYQEAAQVLFKTFQSILPKKILQELEKIGEDIDSYFGPTLGGEIKGIAQAYKVSYGLVALLNLGYELTDFCTSMIAETEKGEILHVRNLDFGIGSGFTDLLRNLTAEVEFQKGGKTVFHAVTYVGYVGILTGMKPHSFSVSVDTRFLPGPVWDILWSLVEAITNKNATLNSFLIRDTLETGNSYESALEVLSTHALISDVYIIMAGTKSGEGVVISRDREKSRDIWKLDAPGRWFEVQTNYDHWNQPPWFDNRRIPAEEGMSHLGRENLSLDGMLKVLTTKPVLNRQTTYSALMNPNQGSFSAYHRYCNDPCPVQILQKEFTSCFSLFQI